MKQEIEKVSLEFDSEIKAVSSQAQLEELRVKYLGKSGKITAIMPMMKTVPAEDKREMGMLVNELKNKIESAVANMQEEFKQRGVNVVIYANQLTRTGFPAMQKAAKTILENHRAKECDDMCMSIKEILTLIPEDY